MASYRPIVWDTRSLEVKVGSLDITPALDDFTIQRPLPEPTRHYSWSGSFTVNAKRLTSIVESLNDLENPTRWAIAAHPVTVKVGGTLIATLRITDYFFDDSPKELRGEGSLGDLLTALDHDYLAATWQQYMGSGLGWTGFGGISIRSMLSSALTYYGITADLSAFPDSYKIAIAEDVPQGSVIQWVQKWLGERGYWLYVDPSEAIKVKPYPWAISEAGIRFTRPYSQLAEFTRRRGVSKPFNKVVVSGTSKQSPPGVSGSSVDKPKITYDYDSQGHLIGRTKIEQTANNTATKIDTVTEEHALAVLDPKLFAGNYGLVTTKITTNTKKADAFGQVVLDERKTKMSLGGALPDLVRELSARSAAAAMPFYTSLIEADKDAVQFTGLHGVVQSRDRKQHKLFRIGATGYALLVQERELEEYELSGFSGSPDVPPPTRYDRNYRRWLREDSEKGSGTTGYVPAPLTLRQYDTSTGQPPSFDVLQSDTQGVGDTTIKGEANFAIPGVTPVTPARLDVGCETLTTDAECTALATMIGNLAIQNYYGRYFTLPVPTEWITDPSPFPAIAAHNGIFVGCGEILAYSAGKTLVLAFNGNYAGAISLVPETALPVYVPPTEHTPVSVSQSSVYGVLTATVGNLSDGDYTTGGVTDLSSWIKLDLGSNKSVGIVRTAGGTLSGFGGVAAYLNSRLLQYSTNDVDWTTAVTIAGASDTAPYYSEQTFTAVSARYWRIASTGSAHTGATEFRLFTPYSTVPPDTPWTYEPPTPPYVVSYAIAFSPGPVDYGLVGQLNPPTVTLTGTIAFTPGAVNYGLVGSEIPSQGDIIEAILFDLDWINYDGDPIELEIYL